MFDSIILAGILFFLGALIDEVRRLRVAIQRDVLARKRAEADEPAASEAP